MASCAACQTSFTKEQRGLKCTLCDERRVAEPAYYCNRGCQKQHWKEHKAFHAQLAALEERVMSSKKQESSARTAQRESLTELLSSSDNPWYSLLAKSDQAKRRGEYREAAKLASKAIAKNPSQPQGHMYLASAYGDSGDLTSCVPHLLKAMELSDTGTKYNRHCGDKTWAQAASNLYSCFTQPECVAPKPAWIRDFEQLKRMADRAVAVLPDEHPGSLVSLQMRSDAYFGDGGASVSANDLRQALRDRRRLVEMFKESVKDGSSQSAFHERKMQRIEAALRARIAADLAAIK